MPSIFHGYPYIRWLVLITTVVALLGAVGISWVTLTSGHAGQSTSLGPPYAWKMLVLIYRETDVHYSWNGRSYHVVAHMTDEDVRRATEIVRRMVGTTDEWSGGEALIEQAFVYSTRPIQSLTSRGEGLGYWVSPNDVKPELDRYAPRGTYDSIIVIWIHDHDGQAVPSPGAWGLSIAPHDWANGAGYSVVNTPDGHGEWPGRYPDEIFIHEWLHQVTGFYAAKGYAIPDLHDAEKYGYSVDEHNSWRQWYIDVMQGRVWDGVRYIGITAEIWRSGTPTNQSSSRPMSQYTVCPVSCSFSQIQAAVQASRAGETITIGPGTYQEDLMITKSLTLRGANRDQTIIMSTQAGRVNAAINITGSGIQVNIEGITITGARIVGDYGGHGIWADGSGRVTIRKSKIFENESNGIGTDRGIQVTVQDSLIVGNRWGIVVWGSGEIQGNTISGNGIGIQMTGIRALIRQNTVSGNGTAIWAGLYPESPGEAIIEENSISENGGAGVALAGSFIATISRNNILNNGGWGVVAHLRKCGYDRDNFTGNVTLINNTISGNTQGQVCLP